MDKTNLKLEFTLRHISAIGELKIINNENNCIKTEIKQFEFYYDENGNLIENK